MVPDLYHLGLCVQNHSGHVGAEVLCVLQKYQYVNTLDYKVDGSM